MPVSTIVDTAGASNANAYTTVAYADQFHLDRSPTDTVWVAASTDQKTAAILRATLLMDAMWVWAGYPTTNEQSLMWPRTGILKRNGWEYVDFNTVPKEIKDATSEYARDLLISDRSADSDVETQGLKSLTAGPVSLEFKDDVQAKVVSDAVVNLIPPGWGYVRGVNRTVRDLIRA